MRIERDDYLHHINDKDKIVSMRRIIDKLEIVIRNHVNEDSDFLDPYERSLAKSILNRFDQIDYMESGGLEEAERKVITIFPSYLDKSLINPSITALRLRGNFQDLSHKDYLGAVLGLGINREKVGDILIDKTHVDFLVKEELRDFIILNLNKIGNRNVSLKEIPFDKLKAVEEAYEDINRVLSSRRIDAFISGCYNLSRGDSAKIIRSGRVKVNWESIDKSSVEVKQGDIISVRGYGRSIFHDIEGVTKKDNLKVLIRKLI